MDKITIKNIKQRFNNSLKRGTGEAYLLLKENPHIDFSELIIKASVRNYAFDPQCESRAEYIYQFIKKAKQKDRIICKVLQILENEKDDDHENALEQLCDLSVLFYKDGYSQTGIILDKWIEENSLKNELSTIGYTQLVRIYGLKGLLKVAEIFGRFISQEDDYKNDCWIIDYIQKENKSIDVYKELESAGKDNKFIKLCYQATLENKKTQPNRKKIIYNYETIKEYINNNKKLYITKERANNILIEDFEKLANNFLSEKEKDKLEKYLYIFSERKFPFDYKSILKIATSPNPKGTRIVEYALEALQYFKSDEIRNLAIDKLTNRRYALEYLPLLVSNYKDGDATLLCDIANKSAYIHALNYLFRDIYSANNTEECKEPLEIIYNKMNCGICRISIIEVLAKNGVLSTDIFRELKYDCNEEVQGFYKKNKKTYEYTIKRIK